MPYIPIVETRGSTARFIVATIGLPEYVRQEPLTKLQRLMYIDGVLSITDRFIPVNPKNRAMYYFIVNTMSITAQNNRLSALGSSGSHNDSPAKEG